MLKLVLFEMGRDVAVVYMVAGMSSRFNGEVKQFAKVGPNDETLIEYSVNQAINADFNKIIFIVGNKTEVGFKEMFGDNYKGVPVYYARQEFDSELRKKPWGSVDALCCAKEIIDCPFVICSGDDIYGEDSFKILIEHVHKNKECAAVGFELGNVLSDDGGVNRGIFELDENKYAKSIKETFGIEKRNFSEKNLSSNNLCAMSFFAMCPEVIEILEKKLKLFKEENKKNPNAECLLSEELSKLIDANLIKMKVYSNLDKWFGVTNPGDEINVRNAISKQSG